MGKLIKLKEKMYLTYKDYIDNDGRYQLEAKEKPYLEKLSHNLAIQTFEERPWYLATPYTKENHEEAYQAACRMAMFLEENDIFTFSPISHSHGMSEYASKQNKTSHDFWLTIDFKYIKLSRGLLVCKMKGWDNSFGIAKEIEFAKTLQKPILYTEYMELPKEFLEWRYT